MKTMWNYEALCGRCGETYNPESLAPSDIQHSCDDHMLGGKPQRVWVIYMTDHGMEYNELKPKKKLVRWKANVAALLLVMVMIAGLVWMATGILNDETQGLPACATEDSDNCYWDGSVMGNGEGKSFTVRDGEVSYWD